MLFRENKSNREFALLEWAKGSKDRLYIECQHPELFLGLYLSQKTLNSALQIICCVPDISAANALAQDISFFDSSLPVEILPGYDISPYSGLYPSYQDVIQRLRWLYRLHFPHEKQVLITTPDALLSPTILFDDFLENCFEYKIGDEFPPQIHIFLSELGYFQTPQVEDCGSYSVRGGIVDIFSPAHDFPIRIELFGDQIETIKFFDPQTQKSLESNSSLLLCPAREFLFKNDNHIPIQKNLSAQDSSESSQYWLEVLRKKQYVDGLEYFLPFSNHSLLSDHLNQKNTLFWCRPIDCERSLLAKISDWENEASANSSVFPAPNMFFPKKDFSSLKNRKQVAVNPFSFESDDEIKGSVVLLDSITQSIIHPKGKGLKEILSQFTEKLKGWKKERYYTLASISSESMYQRVKSFLAEEGFNAKFFESAADIKTEDLTNSFCFVNGGISQSAIFPQEGIVFVNFDHLLDLKTPPKSKSNLEIKKSISLVDLHTGDYAIHSQHGLCKYLGLTTLKIADVDNEFLELLFKDNEKLYLPIYRIDQVQKFQSTTDNLSLDKLGGTRWETAKGKAKGRLREIAADLLNLYSKRMLSKRPAYVISNEELINFEASFPYTETPDQLKAIDDIKSDFAVEKPMDRLICGDVGFGKTEVAMRSIFIAALAGKQVAVIAPTTILTYQHFETFKKRFAPWPIKIGLLNRFTEKKQISNYLSQLESGSLDIVVGTHRLLSKDVKFKNLGLLVIDEEQKFGVTHKEKIRSLKENIDTLTLSATPIPRTLNMSLMGIRDLSIINSPPKDRLPTRTFLLKFNKETIRKNILSEIKRGGQIYFLHNKVASIYSLTDELKQILPEVKIAVAHGQMSENALEDTLVDFLNKKIDVLVCTTIIESGLDIPNANTIFIDNAHTLGLSQLYQLRGRVGRGTHRAYCYLLVPPNKILDRDSEERLRIIKENTALGSGLKIAQHDLELRGSGTILGEEQSGIIESVGYEMYMELLEEAVHELRGTPKTPKLEPEINLKIKALIPASYIPDLRLRLSYYKKLSTIEQESEIDEVESALKDQFGKPPEEVISLFGLMIVRLLCRKLRIKDISAGKDVISLTFLEDTPISAQTIIKLTSMTNKKYSLSPENKLKIRMNDISWSNVYNELSFLITNFK